jgi:hypothetical protein
MTDSAKENNAIVQAPPQQVVARRTSLVERAVHSLLILEITDQRVQELCSALQDFDFDARAEALKTIASFGSQIRSSRRYLDTLIFPLLDNIYHYYGPKMVIGSPIQLELFYHGRLYPPGAEYLDLLRTALESIVGQLQSPDEAVMDVLLYGKLDSQIRALEWIADHNLFRSTHKSVSLYLETAIQSTQQYTPLFLGLRYADAVINNHIDECLYFITDEIIFGHIPDELKATARKYLARLVEETSQKALIQAFATLSESSDYEDLELASEIFDQVMTRAIEEYSDYDLEIICRFKGWPSDKRDDINEDEEFVIEELRRRGL